MGNELNRKDVTGRVPPTETRASSPSSNAREPGQSNEPKTSSLAPVAAEPPAQVPRPPHPPDLLPRIVTVTLLLAVFSLVAIYAIRRPPRTESVSAAGQDVEAVAGVDDREGPDWLHHQATDFAEQFMGVRAPAENTGDVGVRMGATAAGAAFDLEAATRSLDAAQRKARGCWEDAKTDRITVSVRFVPEGLAVEADVRDRAIVGEQAAECFELAFRHATVPSFVGEETTIQRTLQRQANDEP